MGQPVDIMGALMPQVLRVAGTPTPLEMLPGVELPLFFNYANYPTVPAAEAQDERRYRLYVEPIGSIDLILDIEFKSSTEFEVIPKFSDEIYDPDGSLEQAFETQLAVSSLVKTDTGDQARKILAPLEMDIETALWTPVVGSRGLVTLNFLTPSVKWLQFFVKETSAADPGASNRAVIHGINFVRGQGVS